MPDTRNTSKYRLFTKAASFILALVMLFYVLSYWAGGGKIHTVAIEYDGNQYNAYNKSGGISHIHPSVYAKDYINIYQVR